MAKKTKDFRSFVLMLESYSSYSKGRNSLYEDLRECKILSKDNMPIQNYMAMGLFKVVEKELENGDSVTVTIITEKGKWYICDRLIKCGVLSSDDTWENIKRRMNEDIGE